MNSAKGRKCCFPKATFVSARVIRRRVKVETIATVCGQAEWAATQAAHFTASFAFE